MDLNPRPPDCQLAYTPRVVEWLLASRLRRWFDVEATLG